MFLLLCLFHFFSSSLVLIFARMAMVFYQLVNVVGFSVIDVFLSIIIIYPISYMLVECPFLVTLYRKRHPVFNGILNLSDKHRVILY
ncbi:hypothetical protein [Vibrio alfacsensis]|uniref:hypothetical protein n=2 Tax=Vibrio TaxID=662 RepID=UPI001C826ABF|nr:hypothetical protein [Vibrio alfacsensis]